MIYLYMVLEGYFPDKPEIVSRPPAVEKYDRMLQKTNYRLITVLSVLSIST